MSTEIYPVVHVHDSRQAAIQSVLAHALGADGVYLINHYNTASTKLLDEAFNAVARTDEYRNGYIGVNYLWHEAASSSFIHIAHQLSAKKLIRAPDGVWSDATDINALATRKAHGLSSMRYLGGVAFKYTDLYTDNPHKAAAEVERLAPYVDVVTTSGRATGIQPPPDKVRAMKAVTTKPLAAASGISVDNIGDYSGDIDQLLVCSSIEIYKHSGIFDPKKLHDLIQAAHQQ